MVWKPRLLGTKKSRSMGFVQCPSTSSRVPASSRALTPAQSTVSLSQERLVPRPPTPARTRQQPPVQPPRISTSGPAPVRHRSSIPALLLGTAVLLVGARYVLLAWYPTDERAGAILAVARDHSDWAFQAAAVAGGLALVLLLIGRFRRRHDRDAYRVRSAAAGALRIPVDSVVLHKSRWTGGTLVATRISYPNGSVLSDLSAALAEAMEPFAAGPLAVAWARRSDRFTVGLRPPVIKRLEEKYPALTAVFDTMSHIIGTLSVDQKRTRVGPDGSVDRMVASYAHTTRDIGDGFRQRVQTVLDAKAPSPTGYWTLVWDPAANKVTISPAQPLPRTAPYPLTPPEDPLLIPVGIGEGSKTAVWNPIRHPHMLVVGPTGTGKTIFLNGLVTGCLSRGWKVLLADPKELSFRGFDPVSLHHIGRPVWPGIDCVGTTESGMEQVIEDAYVEMRRRYEAVKTFSVREQDLQPLLLFVDEAGELVERLTEYHTGEEKYRDLLAAAVARGEDPDSVAKPKGTRNPMLRKIWSILRLGRQCRVFVIIATQRPDVSFIPGEARSNLIARVGLGKLDGAALEMVFGTRAIQQRVFEVSVDPATGQRRRDRVEGRATVDLGSGPQTIQGYWVPDPAKAITEELTAADLRLVDSLQEFVVTNRRRCLDAATLPLPELPLAVDARAVQQAGVDTVEEANPEPEGSDDSDRGGGGPTVRADRLERLSMARIEVDGRLTTVIITEIEPDPFSDPGEDELQLTFEISDDDPRAGQVGVTTFRANEQVQLALQDD